MGLLLGLPLRLLGLVFTLIRCLIPLALILFFVWLWRRQRQEYHRQDGPGRKQEPGRRGPVYTVDYREVSSEDERHHHQDH